MADIFISYSRTDRGRVAPLVAALEAQGWSVWWDPEITPGDEFDALISAELESARAVVVVWSPLSVDSRWVKGEARDAADRGVLVPVRFENARLPIDVRSIHTTDLDDWGGNRDSGPFKALCAALEAKLKLSAAKKTVAQAARDKRPAVAICVLPFANMSGDPEQEYFSDGITEDIITDLGKVSALSIVSRNTAFSFKGATADLAQIARQTKASHVLFGSVRKSGARVRITAQLVGAANDSQVWGERYDRDLNDIFALQDEISKAIVAALKLTLLPEEKQALQQRGTSNPEAYKLYLMARQFWLLDNERDNEIVVRICNRVIEIDPHYAQAWATMALAQWNMFWRGDSGADGERAAETALRLDSESRRFACCHGCSASQQGSVPGGADLLPARAAPGAQFIRRQQNRRPLLPRPAPLRRSDQPFRAGGRRDGNGFHRGDVHLAGLQGQGRRGTHAQRRTACSGSHREGRGRRSRS